MDTRTGELYKNIDDAEKKLKEEGLTEEEMMKALMPLNAEKYFELMEMNRAARRRWAREQKKKQKKRR